MGQHHTTEATPVGWPDASGNMRRQPVAEPESGQISQAICTPGKPEAWWQWRGSPMGALAEAVTCLLSHTREALHAVGCAMTGEEHTPLAQQPTGRDEARRDGHAAARGGRCREDVFGCERSNERRGAHSYVQNRGSPPPAARFSVGAANGGPQAGAPRCDPHRGTRPLRCRFTEHPFGYQPPAPAARPPPYRKPTASCQFHLRASGEKAGLAAISSPATHVPLPNCVVIRNANFQVSLPNAQPYPSRRYFPLRTRSHTSRNQSPRLATQDEPPLPRLNRREGVDDDPRTPSLTDALEPSHRRRYSSSFGPHRATTDPLVMRADPFRARHDPPVTFDQLRPAKRISASPLNPQPLPPPLQTADGTPTRTAVFAESKPSQEPSPACSVDSSANASLSEPRSDASGTTRREDRQIPPASAKSRPTATSAASSLSERLSNRDNLKNRALLAKRLRGASAAHSESTGSLVELASSSTVDSASDPTQVMSRSHRRRASESSGYAFGQRPKRPYSEQNIHRNAANIHMHRKRTPLALADFRLSKVLGSGGTATVIRAEPLPGSIAAAAIPAKEIALKAVSKKGLNRRAQHYLTREIAIHRYVQNHPNIASLYEVFEDSSGVYIVMELLRGSDLYSALRRERRGLSERIGLKITAQILDALQYMHSMGYAHRDIKPENLMFAEKPAFAGGRMPPIKLIDFGLACARDPTAPEKDRTSSEKCGTVRYAAPEIVTETAYVPELCDIWSVGIVLYSIIAHRNPYTGKTEKEVLHQIQHTKLSFDGMEWERVSEDTKKLIRWCLSRKASDRPNAATALREVNRIIDELSQRPGSPRGSHEGRQQGDVSGFSSHVTPEQGSSKRRCDTATNGGGKSPPPRSSSEEGHGQPANFLDGLIKAFFSGGSSPERSGSDNSN